MFGSQFISHNTTFYLLKWSMFYLSKSAMFLIRRHNRPVSEQSGRHPWFNQKCPPCRNQSLRLTMARLSPHLSPVSGFSVTCESEKIRWRCLFFVGEKSEHMLMLIKKIAFPKKFTMHPLVCRLSWNIILDARQPLITSLEVWCLSITLMADIGSW